MRYLLLLLSLGLSSVMLAQVGNDFGDDRDPTLRGNGPSTPRSASATFALPPPDELLHLDRLLVGGSLGASIGNIIFIDLSPSVGYRLTDLMRVGAGFTYRYQNDRRDFGFGKQQVIGGRAWVQHDLFFGFFGHVEYENLVSRWETNGIEFSGRYPMLMLGGGYSMQLGQKSVSQIQVLYPVALNPGQSLYFFPIDVRINFLFGL
jgi:hypothetical protein